MNKRTFFKCFLFFKQVTFRNRRRSQTPTDYTFVDFSEWNGPLELWRHSSRPALLALVLQAPGQTPDLEEWVLVPCSAALALILRCRQKNCLSSHQRPSRPISFPLCFLLSTGRLLKIELSISRWVRHRWDSNRRSGGLIIVIYQNQHFEASAECLSDGETLNHLKQTEIF